MDTTDSSLTVTFFDQKVDLAQFTEDTPLYVMCREWMRNSSHSLGGVSGTGRSDGVYREELVLLQAVEVSHALVIVRWWCLSGDSQVVV